MKEEQRLHAELLVKQFKELVLPKYEAGAIEHTGNLWEVDRDKLLDYAIEEAIDQVVYLLTLKGKL